MPKSPTVDSPLLVPGGSKPETPANSTGARLAALVLVVVAVQVAASLWSLDTAGPASLRPVSLASSSSVQCGVAHSETGYVALANRKNASHYFYWYFESRSRPESDPLVVWLTGRPGCSSLMALLTENGPCTVTADGSATELNPFAWNARANVIWLDQPSNVGFSYTNAGERPDDSEYDVAENMLAFLRGFVAKRPELRGRELFLTGESYAGHYVPAAAHRIWRDTTSNASDKLELKLAGVAIGNGITDPVLQTQHQLDMADNAYNVTLMSPEDYATAKALQPKCTERLKELVARRKVDALDSECEDVLLQPFHKSRVNPHDIRVPCVGGGDCYDMTGVTATT